MRSILLCCILICAFSVLSYAQEADRVKQPNVGGQFYPGDKTILGAEIDKFLNSAAPPQEKIENILAIICPHAGYDFSAQTAAFSYKLIQGRLFKTVVIIAPAHYYGFDGVSVYQSGRFRTPLGDLEIDSEFAGKIISPAENISFIPEAFEKEHSLEVQLPFLQKVLKDFRIVPVIIGGCEYTVLENFARRLAKTIDKRRDILLVISTDLYHGYDYTEAEITDNFTLSELKNMSAQDIHSKLKGGAIQMCGGLPVIAGILTAQSLGYNKLEVLKYTNSALVTNRKTKGVWTVGYAAGVISRKEERDMMMLDTKQKKRLLELARKTIEEYIVHGKKPDFKEDDPKLKEINGAFVTLRKDGELRGCIGNIIGTQPLFQTVRDMAIESATGDPRFSAVTKDELDSIEIEISVLSPLKRIRALNEFILGTHGVLIRKGWNSGVFLPQVASETGWTKEEFLSNLCLHKAGLPADSWKDLDSVQLFIFSAVVFSEKEVQ